MTVRWQGAEISVKVQLAIMRGLLTAAERVRDSAVESILSGEKTGKVYNRRGVAHQASAPGEPPASDIGNLSRSFDVVPELALLRVIVNNNAKYAAALEYGSQRIEPRPFLRPALARNVALINALVAREVAASL